MPQGQEGYQVPADLQQEQSNRMLEMLKDSKKEELTFGKKAVGYTFNPSGDGMVEQCKGGFADLIDQMNNLREKSTSSEQKRLCSVAITEAQAAQMWAVKALTWRD